MSTRQDLIVFVLLSAHAERVFVSKTQDFLYINSLSWKNRCKNRAGNIHRFHKPKLYIALTYMAVQTHWFRVCAVEMLLFSITWASKKEAGPLRERPRLISDGFKSYRNVKVGASGLAKVWILHWQELACGGYDIKGFTLPSSPLCDKWNSLKNFANDANDSYQTLAIYQGCQTKPWYHCSTKTLQLIFSFS